MGCYLRLGSSVSVPGCAGPGGPFEWYRAVGGMRAPMCKSCGEFSTMFGWEPTSEPADPDQISVWEVLES